jgi:hypothetical protein
MRHLLRLTLVPLLACVLATPSAAVSLQEATFVSPVTRVSFPAQVLSRGTTDNGEADLGADLDGCRHTLLQSEYEYGVVVDPTSYFAALASEWDPRNGAFLFPFDKTAWATIAAGLESERLVDLNNAYRAVVNQARAAGQVPPERGGFQIPQRLIRIEKRYQLALTCYEARKARSSLMAKVGLQAAWALRSYLNVPLANPGLDGGYQELDDRLKRRLVAGEPFRVERHLAAHQEILAEGAGLTDEGFFAASLVTLGLTLRAGDPAAGVTVITGLEERFRNVPKAEFMRSLTRERKETWKKHQDFLALALVNFIRAIADEQFNRTDLPPTMLAVAECQRRLGRRQEALMWYTALAAMPETQPKLRDDIRRQQRSPATGAPMPVQLGWLADEQITALRAAGATGDGQPDGPDRSVLVALVAEGLGSADYTNPGWRPTTGGTANDCIAVLSKVGDATLNFSFRTGLWPLNLGELWDRDFIDRNQVNRFRCPVTGQPFAYAEPPTAADATAANTVVVATTATVETPMGQRFGAYLADKRIVWSATAFTPGQRHEP